MNNLIRSKAKSAGYCLAAALLTLPVGAFAATGDGTNGGEPYGLGAQGGGPQATDYQLAAQGFNASLSPMLVALLPVFVVILAIWMGPALLKKLLTMAAGH